MKLSLVLFWVLVAIVSTGEAANLRSPRELDGAEDAVERQLAKDDPQRSQDLKLLRSEECAEYMDNLMKARSEILGMDDEEIMKSLCTKEKRDDLIEEEKKAEEEVANNRRSLASDTSTNPECILAYDRYLLGEKAIFDKAIVSSKGCEKEVRKELGKIHEDERRALAKEGHRRLWGKPKWCCNPAPVIDWAAKKAREALDAVKREWNQWTDKVKNLEGQVNKLNSQVRDVATKLSRDLQNQANTLARQAKTQLDNAVRDAKRQAETSARSIKSTAEQQARNTKKAALDAKNAAVKLKEQAEKELNSVTGTLKKIPGLLEDEIINPITRDIDKAVDDIKKLDDIAMVLADNAMKEIKKLNWLPKLGEELANVVAKGILGFISSEFCVPYDCIAKKFNIDISNVKLYESEKLSLTTALNPKTCFQVTDVKFDGLALGNFLNLFKDPKILEDMFREVKTYIQNQMNSILDFADDIDKQLEDIKGIADDAIKTLGLDKLPFRRRLISVESKEHVSMEEMSARAYELGKEKYRELYGEHILKVFHERQLATNADKYMVIKSFKVKLTQDFGQTFTLTAADRAGFGGSLFDESLHKTKVIPIPETGNMVRLVASGSLETSMPYVMGAEAEATAEFGYNVGEASVEVDLVTGKVTTNKDPFTTNMEVDGSVGLSGSMSLNFAASASMGICLGATDDACITLTIDAHQDSAAGFDALAQVNINSDKTPLTAMYTDVMEYDKQPDCNGQLSLSAGYWQYIKEPSVSISLTATGFCMDKSQSLFAYKGKVFQKSSKSFCIDAGKPTPVGVRPPKPGLPGAPNKKPVQAPSKKPTKKPTKLPTVKKYRTIEWKGHSECPSGTRIMTKGHCLTAAKSLGFPGSVHEGDWGHNPCGCFYYPKGHQLYFDKGNDCNNPDKHKAGYKNICKKTPAEIAKEMAAAELKKRAKTAVKNAVKKQVTGDKTRT